MTIQDIAGFCPEEAIWKMMADVSAFLLNDDAVHMLAPASVIVDGNMFITCGDAKVAPEYLAPEQDHDTDGKELQLVWQIGALAYLMATGHVVFGGHGGRYQREHPHVSLPVLPKNLSLLTPVIQRCLCYEPVKRVGMKELNAMATKGLAACSRQQRVKAEQPSGKALLRNSEGDKWPEEMIEI